MKTLHLTSAIAALALALPMAAHSQNSSSVSDSGSSSATARQSGATSGSATSTSASMAFHNGEPYIVRNNQATRLDQSTIRPGQMLTSDGQVVDIPKGIAGLKGMTSNIADSGSASATARLSGSTSGSQTSVNTQDGWIMQDGELYRVENGRATRVEQSSIPSGQVMNVQGRTSAMPEGVTFNSSNRRSGDASNSNRGAADQNRSSSGANNSTSGSASSTNSSR